MGDRIPPVPVWSSSSAASWPEVVERLPDFGAARARRSAREQCEFCGATVDQEHGHLVDIPNHALLCVCGPCYLVFAHRGAGGGRFLAVPTRYVLASNLDATADTWERLDMPAGLAFFFRDGGTGQITAFFASPAGATESALPLDAWDALTNASPVLSTLEADVEALLVRRAAAGLTALLVPIDACYELVGLIRVSWRGLQGGDELWARVDAFLARAVGRAHGRVTQIGRQGRSCAIGALTNDAGR
jgi:hypothetical protein